MWSVCPRCRLKVQDKGYAGPCAMCVQQLRDDAAIAGAQIAAHSETITDHRSLGERLRED